MEEYLVIQVQIRVIRLLYHLFSIKLNKKKNVFYDFNSKRDFVHIDDICSAIYILLKKKSSGIYNIGSGKSVKISNIVTFFFKVV